MRECQFAIFIAALFGLSACEALQGLPEKNRRSADDDFSRSTPTPGYYRNPRNPGGDPGDSGDQNTSGPAQSSTTAPRILKADIYQKFIQNRNDSGSALVAMSVSERKNASINPNKIEVRRVNQAPVVSGGQIVDHANFYSVSSTDSAGKKQFDIDNSDYVASSYTYTRPTFGPAVDFEEMNSSSNPSERVYRLNLFALANNSFQDNLFRISNIRFTEGHGRIKSVRLLPGDSALKDNKARREVSFGDDFIQIRHATALGEWDSFISPVSYHPQGSIHSTRVSDYGSPQNFLDHFSETYEVIVEN